MFAAFGARLALGWRGGIQAGLLLTVVIASALWAASGLAVAIGSEPRAVLALDAFDALRYTIWFVFLQSLVKRPRQSDSPAQSTARLIPWWLMAVVVGGLLISVVLSDATMLTSIVGSAGRTVTFSVWLGVTIFGLILVEQLMRQAPQARWAIKPLCLALAGIFGFDLFYYADAMLFGRLDLDIWAARGIAHALVIPLVAVATARNTAWTIEMHMSRGVVFQSAALLGSGVFLLALAAAGYFIRYISGEWGKALEIELLFAAFLLFALVAFSGSFRSKLRVFVSKHFFSYRYDYREEWLRFSRTLSTGGSSQLVHERSIKALADLVESPAGALWLKQEDQSFLP